MTAPNADKLFRAALDAVADGLLLVDADGAVIAFNQPYIDLFTLPQSILELRDDRMTLAFVQGQMRNPQTFLAATEELYAAAELDSRDLLEFSDGRMVERTSQPLRIDGQVAGRVWMYHVVSAQSTRFVEQKFRALVEQSIVGIYVIQNGFFTYINPRTLEILGYNFEELTGRPVLEFVTPEDREMTAANIRKRMEGTIESAHYTLRLTHKTGRVVPVEVHGTRIVYEHKPAILGTMLDLTGRVQPHAGNGSGAMI